MVIFFGINNILIFYLFTFLQKTEERDIVKIPGWTFKKKQIKVEISNYLIYVIGTIFKPIRSIIINSRIVKTSNEKEYPTIYALNFIK